jgi:hypothetical protein
VLLCRNCHGEVHAGLVPAPLISELHAKLRALLPSPLVLPSTKD